MSDFAKRFDAAPTPEEFAKRFDAAPIHVEPLKPNDRSFQFNEMPPPPQTAADLLKEDRPLGKVARTLIDTAPGAAVARKASEGFAPTTQTGTALRSFGQGASLGLTDEAAGVLGAADEFQARHPVLGAFAKGALGAASPIMGAAAATTPGNSEFSSDSLADALRKRYALDRDMERRDIRRGGEANPVVAGAAELAGNLALPMPGPGKVKTVGDFAKTAGAGALGGGVMGFGKAEGDAGAQALNTGAGAALGGVLTPVAGAVATKAGDALGAYLQKKAQENALKGIGLRAGISSQLEKRGYETADEARKLGQDVLDMDLLRFGGKAEGVAQRATEAQSRYGAAQRNLLESADKFGPADPDALSLRAALTVHGPEGLSPAAVGQVGPARKAVEQIGKLGQAGDAPTLVDANRLKSDIYDAINFANDPALKSRLQQRAASGLRQGIEDEVGTRLGPQAVDELRTINQRYGALSDIAPLAREEANRQMERKTLTALDIASALGGGAAGHAAGGNIGGIVGGVAPIAAKLAGPRVASSMALTQQALAPIAKGPAAQYVAGQGAKFAALRAVLDAGSPEAMKEQSKDAYLRGTE